MIEMMTDMDHPLIVKTIVWPDETATQAFAQSLALKPGLGQAMLELHGDLGAGKTTFVRYLLAALGVEGRIKSPTYAVVEPYTLEKNASALNIWHFDFYRFNDPEEWEDAGFREIFASPGLKLVEWPENAGPHLPRADLRINLETNDDESRNVTLSALTDIGQDLLS
jgi:tRNA threonylcarbamoyladenosine biosynthesis protein TsaE